VAVSKTSGTRYYIGPVVDTDAIQALTDEDAVTYFEGLSWTEVEEIESFGSFGDTAATASFASVKDRRMRKYKTTRDGGTMAIVCGRDPLDAGQIALAAAERTDFNYAFKVVFADTATRITPIRSSISAAWSFRARPTWAASATSRNRTSTSR
jgi:hypothetical protein